MKKPFCLILILASCLISLFGFATPAAKATGLYERTIFAGHNYAMVIRDDGSLWSWGMNNFGQLGCGGQIKTRKTPAKTLDFVTAVSDGKAIRQDGSLWSWGYNEEGQVGDGTTTNRFIPVKVMDSVADISARNVSMALQEDGSLWTWGYNNAGEVGDGTFENRQWPVKILDDVIAFENNGNNAAIKTDGSLWAWGYRATRLSVTGDDHFDRRELPEKIADSVVSVKTDLEHTVFIKRDRSLWVMEENYDRLFLISLENYDKGPIKVMDSVADVSLQPSFTMALKQDGSLWTWGYNTDGSLGLGSSVDVQRTPVKVMDSVLSILTGPSFAMAIKTDGSLWAWGNNQCGQLGVDENSRVQYTPVKVMDSVVAVEHSSGVFGDSVYAIKQDGTLWAWGDNEHYQLGDGTNKTRYTPVKIMDHVMIPGGENAVPLGVSSWAIDEINSLSARGLIPAALKFNFQQPIRRDEFMALMVNVYESVKSSVPTYSSPFYDITNSTYVAAIEKAYALGLIDGTSATKFTPGDLLTREQAAKILCNVVASIETIDPKPQGPPNYTDSSVISGWAIDFVAYAQENKIMKGSSTGRFNPKNNLTREEAMLVAERLIVQYGWA